MSLNQSLNKILIIDFGSQFTQLIARRIRELGVYSEIISHKKIKDVHIDNSIKGIILSGGPLNVYEIKKYYFDKEIISKGLPVLGICFGHQILSKLNGGKVKQSKHREFGLTEIKKKRDSLLIKGIFSNKNQIINVWMSHADQVSVMPKNFVLVASSKNSKFTIIENDLINNYQKIYSTYSSDNSKIFYQVSELLMKNSFEKTNLFRLGRYDRTEQSINRSRLYSEMLDLNFDKNGLYFIENFDHLRHIKYIINDTNHGLFNKQDIWYIIPEGKNLMNTIDLKKKDEINFYEINLNLKEKINFKDKNGILGFGWSHGSYGKVYSNSGAWAEGNKSF